MRWTLERLKPQVLDGERVDQWVASAGVDSKVRVKTRSISASLKRRGAPGRGSSSKPSSRSSMNRLRHLPTVCLVQPSWAATSVLLLPAAAGEIARERCAGACAEVRRRTQRSRLSRPSELKSNGRKTLSPRVVLGLNATHATSTTGYWARDEAIEESPN